MTKGFFTMLTLSLTIAVISVGTLAYILIEQPEYLRADRDGVPFYTPQVQHPDGGEPLNMGELIRHYKGG